MAGVIRKRLRRTSQSEALFARGRARMPGGVSSPVRSFASVGGNPFFVKKGRGATVIDSEYSVLCLPSIGSSSGPSTDRDSSSGAPMMSRNVMSGKSGP